MIHHDPGHALGFLQVPPRNPSVASQGQSQGAAFFRAAWKSTELGMWEFRSRIRQRTGRWHGPLDPHGTPHLGKYEEHCRATSERT